MDCLLSEAVTEDRVCLWQAPLRWWQKQNPGRAYWIFFMAAFCFDAGFALYYFLFNLFLVDAGFDERAIGWITGAATFGSMLATLPAGELSRRFGLRRTLIVCFTLTPLVAMARTLVFGLAAQVALGFIGGACICLWGVCYLPAVAGITEDRMRATGYSLIFSASVLTSVIGGLICSYLPVLLAWMHLVVPPLIYKRNLLCAACVVAFCGVVPILKLSPVDLPQDAQGNAWRHGWKTTPFLRRYLPSMAVWSAVMAAFAPFGAVYLERERHLPLSSVGVVFACVQALQLFLGLITPLVVRIFGPLYAIVAMQTAAACSLIVLAWTHQTVMALAMYLIFSALQWMSSPALYNLLMGETPVEKRSAAASEALFCNALLATVAAPLAGIMIARSGYAAAMLCIAAVAILAAGLFVLLVRPAMHPENN